MGKLETSDIPKDWPVQPADSSSFGKIGLARCCQCGLAWDDSKSTSMTPTPSGRCPFEQFHKYEEIVVTPERWYDANDEEDHWLLCSEPTDRVIATFYKGDDEETKDRALRDCQLCAAAPELLRMLISCKERITELSNDKDACWNDWPLSYEVDLAIAKAEGK